MKKLIFILSIIVSTILTFSVAMGQPTLGSEDLTAKQREIMHKVMAIDGTINENMHIEFWNEMPQHIKDEWDSNLPLMIFLSKQLKLAQEYQRAMWESALLSYKNKKFIKNDTLINLENTVKNSINREFGGTSQFSKTEMIYQAGFSNSEQILFAAASHSFSKVNGEDIVIDDVLINQILEKLDERIERIKILLDPKYYIRKNNAEMSTPENEKNFSNTALLRPTAPEKSFLSCSLVALGTLYNVSDYLSGVPLEKVLETRIESEAIKKNAILVYSLMKDKGLKTTLFSIHLSLTKCARSIPDYINKQKSDPYGLCVWNDANNLLILLHLDSGKTSEEIKNKVPKFLHEKVDFLSRRSKEKNIESALVGISDIFKDCVSQVIEDEKTQTHIPATNK